MVRIFRSLALPTSITLIFLVATALAGDRTSRDGLSASNRDSGGNASKRDPDRSASNRDPGRSASNRDTGRTSSNRDSGRSAANRDKADAAPRSAPIQPRNYRDFPPLVARRPIRPEGEEKPDADEIAEKAAQMGFSGKMVAGGFEVTDVKVNGPAAAAGLQVGDVIVAANGIAIRSINDARQAIQAARGVLNLQVVDAITGAAARRVVRF